ncbi:MAG TPA: DEAD/DEAH box helicase, partial [Caldithrix abyssi]|nr:DEAD/DEAH box helicase [Caldithrix abyssi]
MIQTVFKKIFGSKNDREVSKLSLVVDEINEFYEQFQSLSEEQLKAKTDEFRQRLQDGETTDDILPEAFAVVKEACRRLKGQSWKVAGREQTWDMVPFDVQLVGGIVLHQGKIAEMATGEGKTLVATLPLYLNALEGKGAHLVTVNDYLALRDSEWMGHVLNYLGLTVGVILGDMTPEQRREAYNCDVTYGTNNEFGFDYLRDNMAGSVDNIVQVRGHHYSIVDEVDSVLIDEARTPLIISGPVSVSTHRYAEMKPLVERLVTAQNRLVNR